MQSDGVANPRLQAKARWTRAINRVQSQNLARQFISGLKARRDEISVTAINLSDGLKPLKALVNALKRAKAPVMNVISCGDFDLPASLSRVYPVSPLLFLLFLLLFFFFFSSSSSFSFSFSFCVCFCCCFFFFFIIFLGGGGLRGCGLAHRATTHSNHP